MNRGGLSLTRTSTAKAAVNNVMTVLKTIYGIDTEAYDIHINFAGGMPVDGPSAGTAVFVACYSAVQGLAVSNSFAFTGEISIKGLVKPVGGVAAKIEAAQRAGAKTVFIPKQNYQKKFADYDIEVVCAETIQDIIRRVFVPAGEKVVDIAAAEANSGLASAKGKE